jgi:hypothetical protein
MTETSSGIQIELDDGTTAGFASWNEHNRALHLASVRQQQAGAAAPAWHELTEAERAGMTVTARNWLRAAEAAGLLAPHRGTVADDAPEWGKLVDVAELLEAGGTVVLGYYPGESGATNEDGDVTSDPVEGGFTAEAYDVDDREFGSGGGESPAAALADVRGPWRQGVSGITSGAYVNEPPF